MIIPYGKLSPEALQGVIEQFITRDGPDSGHSDVSFERKVEQVKRQLETGTALILYDETLHSCNIVSRDDPFLKDYLA